MLTEEHRNVLVVGDTDQCLVEGTQITMGDGSLSRSSRSSVGDDVLSCYGSGDFRPARVMRVHRVVRITREWYADSSAPKTTSASTPVRCVADRPI